MPYSTQIASFATLLFFAWCPLLDRALAQTPPTLDPSKAVSQYIHEAWQTDDGLPQNSVAALAQTRDGYLWLGTEEGLVRFDGVRFTVFDKRTVEAFLSNDVSALLEDRAGTLWVGTRGGGLLAYADGRFTAHTTETGLPSDVITALYEDRAGTLWIGTYGGGLVQYRDGAFTAFAADAGFPGSLVSTIHESAGGRLRVGSEAGLFSFDGERFAPSGPAPLNEAFIGALLEDRTGGLWISTRDHGLYRLDGDTITAFGAEPALVAGGYVSTLLEDTEGSVWLGLGSGGLVRYRDGAFEAYTAPAGADAPSFTGRDVLALYEDVEGSLWIGTRSGGLHRLRDGLFTPYAVAEGLADNQVYSIYEAPDGSVWFGTAGGLSRLEGGAMTTYTTRDGLTSDEVLTVYGGAGGAVWIGTYGGGLNRLEGGRITTYTTGDGLPSDNVFALYRDRRGDLWIGTDAGVARYDGATFHTLSTADGLSSDFITAFAEGRDGTVWVGTYDAGVNRLEGGRADGLSHVSTAEGLSSDAVLALYEDEEGVLWIGTYGGGLNRLDGGRVTAYTTREGLLNDNVYVILEDDAGHLWMTCNVGVFRVARQELAAFDAGDRASIASPSYGTVDGLRSVEATGGQQPAGWKGADGRLWFPTIRGAAVVDPAHTGRNPLPPPVVIERLLVDNRPVEDAAGLVLPPGGRRFTFDFTALSLVVPERVLFRYRLEGVDDAWSEAAPQREATYTNLPPGSYTFRVTASNNDGVWNETGAALSFYLQPHFYQTAWFRGLCILALLFVGWAGYRLRINQLHARQEELERTVEHRTHDLRIEKERTEQAKAVIEAQAHKLQELDRFKTRFFANVSHEFRTPLTMIIGPLENALHGRYGVLEGPLRRQVEIMLRNAQRLLRLINQLLDLSKLEAGKMELRARLRDIVRFLDGIVLSSTPLAEQKGIALRFEPAPETVALYYEPDKLEKVFFNLLSNAIKFTPRGGTITVALAETPPGPDGAWPDGAVEIRVRDSGRGIPEADLPYVFDRFHQVDGSNTRDHEGTGIGLALVKELVLLHGGEIDVASEVGAGTEFRILLPRGDAHLQKEQLIRDEPDDEDASYEASTELASVALDATPEPEPAPSHEGLLEPMALVGKLHVLVVDDNRDVREYISGILSEAYRVTTAFDGVDGLEKARSLQPDLIVSDVMMPRMDGNELCRRVKSDPALDHIPVILVTAKATQELKMEGLEGGADDYLAKPFNASELFVRARNLLQMYHQEKELKLLNEDLERKVQEQLDLILTERRHYERELIEARDKAEASSRLKSTILSAVSHEFRTPIAGILGSTEILSMEVADEQREFVDLITQSGLRISKTLDAVLDLSQLESEQYALRTVPINLSVPAREAVASFRPLAEKKALTLHVEADANVTAHLDPEAVHRMLVHLLDNAIKFTEAGSITVEVARRGDRALLIVRDTGIGIDPSFVPRIYDAFTQESAGIARSFEGCGIGLTIVKRLAELMGGTVSVESRKGEGSTFTVAFPAVPPAPVAPDAAASDTAGDADSDAAADAAPAGAYTETAREPRARS